MGYIKYHSAWSGSDLISGKAMNHIEGQWAAIKADVDIHEHDTRYYPKATADVTFFSTSFYSGFDADKLDGYDADVFMGSAIPIGGIVIWKGTAATVPANYGVCDGTTYSGKASPDLRNRFIVGAGSAYSASQTGGAATFTPTGSVTVGAHALTTTEIPSHRHSYTDTYNPPGPDHQVNYGWAYRPTGPTARNAEYQNEGGGQAHDHTNGSSVTLNSVSALPPYYSLIYIMKYA